MSESESLKARPVAHVSVDDLGAFMSDKGIVNTCSACQQDAGWSSYISEYGVTSIPIYKDGDVLIGGGAVEALTLRCQNCGHIRMFDLNVYKAWKQNNGPT